MIVGASVSVQQVATWVYNPDYNLVQPLSHFVLLLKYLLTKYTCFDTNKWQVHMFEREPQLDDAVTWLEQFESEYILKLI